MHPVSRRVKLSSSSSTQVQQEPTPKLILYLGVKPNNATIVEKSPYRARPTPAPKPSPAKPAASSPLVRTRTKSTTSLRSATPSKPSKPPPVPDLPDSSQPALSLKEVIALKRAEAKKAQASGSTSALDNFIGLEDALPSVAQKPEEEDILGRWPLRETLERGRSTGIVNISSRSLPCIPSALFEIHLGVTADPLKSVPEEPPLPASDPVRRGSKLDAPAWYESQDLQVLKAWDNDIVEIQHEISFFGSLKTIDFHKNKITFLPSTFGDLTALTSLDLSHNALTSLPSNLFALPELAVLNISNNALTSLPFSEFFTDSRSKVDKSGTGSFFTPTINRASTPLPRLTVLNVSHNKLTTGSIDTAIPASVTKLDLSANPLGLSDHSWQPLLHALGALKNLKELRFQNAEVGNEAFPPSLFSSASITFPSLSLLDLGETKVTEEAVKSALQPMKQQLTFDVTAEDPPAGVTRVVVGKKVIREAWELEAERRAKSRAGKAVDAGLEWENTPASRTKTGASSTSNRPRTEAVKEAWEIEADQGLLTEGGKRRARAAAAAAAAAAEKETGALTLGRGAPPNKGPPAQSRFSLTDPQYYTQLTRTLKLPASVAPPKALGHSRAFSLASPSLSSFPSSSSLTTDIALPTPTLPLTLIASQPFAHTLKILILTNRRMDRSFSMPPLPANGESLLPSLEELNLEGCGLADLVPVSQSSDLLSETPASPSPTRTNEPLLALLSKLFPSLRTLNLAYNALTSSALTTEALTALILSSPSESKKGLKQLHLRGNRIAELDGFQGIADLFKNNRQVPEWELDELDLRDNEIGKLPPPLGLLPLDVLLVDGNTFRVPQRRVWEREGTKGLLSWLRGRID